MTRLRKMMLEELQRRNFSEDTIRHYIHTVEDFARHFDRPPDRLGLRHIREYQAYLFQKRKLSSGSVTNHLAALRFFYIQTLKKAWSVAETPYPKKNHHLPAILSQEEVARLIDAADTPFHRTLLMTLYATGLRRAEVTHLKVNDIDSKRMVIHVRAGKGRKDRDVMLSPKLLEELRQHWLRLRRKTATGSFPVTVGILRPTRSTQKRYTTPAKEPRSARVSTVPFIPTPCAIASLLICSKPAPICVPFRSC
jgi:integrase/recombinase XerD